MEFDFHGDVEGESHFIGFETDDKGSSSQVWQLWGSKRYGKQNFNNYSAGKSRFTIPVGQYLRHRKYNSIVFVQDHDAPPQDARSSVSNVRVYETQSEN